MNDDRLTELMLRASAYLDGELDADEMALAEADPELMAEVEQLRALQAEVRDVSGVDPPTAAARESAIAAALAEFDSIRADVASVDEPAPDTPSRVVPFRPRPSYTRWLTAAAAFVAVGLVGVVASQGLGGSDDDAASESADLQEATADRAEGAEALPSIAADTGAGADEEMAATELEAPPADEPMMDATMAEVESAPTEAPGSGDGDATTAIPSFEVPVTPESLLAVGQDLLGQFQEGRLITPNTACAIEGFEVLSATLFDDGVEVRDVIIAADPATGEVGAFDAATCDNVALVTGP